MRSWTMAIQFALGMEYAATLEHLRWKDKSGYLSFVAHGSA
jgi:hypothetical protein